MTVEDEHAQREEKTTEDSLTNTTASLPHLGTPLVQGGGNTTTSLSFVTSFSGCASTEME